MMKFFFLYLVVSLKLSALTVVDLEANHTLELSNLGVRFYDFFMGPGVGVKKTLRVEEGDGDFQLFNDEGEILFKISNRGDGVEIICNLEGDLYISHTVPYKASSRASSTGAVVVTRLARFVL